MDTAYMSSFDLSKAPETIGRVIRDVAPYVSPSESTNINTNLALIFNQTVDMDNGDALHAVKMDPAVLEVQVTLDTNSLSQRDTPSKDQVLVARHKEISSNSSCFEKMLSKQQAALLSLTPEQFDLLMKYVHTLRRQRVSYQINLECAFCKNNGESLMWYSSHALKDWRGRVLCPVLRAFRCPRCGATGDRAHTIKYCPESSDVDIWSQTSWP